MIVGNSAYSHTPAADLCAPGPGNSLLVTFISSKNYGKQPLLEASPATGSPTLTVLSIQTSAQPTYGSESPASPTVWDAAKLRGCICDTHSMGNGTRAIGYDTQRFTGPACQLSRCPYGIHPKYPFIPAMGNAAALQTEKQGFACKGQPSSRFFMVFRGAQSAEVLGSSTPQLLKEALEGMNSIGVVSVTCAAASICTPAGTTCSITFETELGDVPSLRIQHVAPSASSLPAEAYFWEELKGTGDPQECAGRGQCKRDHEIGMCDCEAANVSSGGPGKLGARGDCGYQRIHARARS